MTHLSNYFNLAEVTKSDSAARLGIDNTVPESLLPNVRFTANRMDSVRVNLGVAVHVNSWYRCMALNRAVRSKDNSDHLLGLAVDFIAPDFGTPLEICKYLLQYKSTLGWKQLILEHTWVHISFDPAAVHNPKLEVLTLLANGGYAIGLTDKYGNRV